MDAPLDSFDDVPDADSDGSVKGKNYNDPGDFVRDYAIAPKYLSPLYRLFDKMWDKLDSLSPFSGYGNRIVFYRKLFGHFMTQSYRMSPFPVNRIVKNCYSFASIMYIFRQAKEEYLRFALPMQQKHNQRTIINRRDINLLEKFLDAMFGANVYLCVIGDVECDGERPNEVMCVQRGVYPISLTENYMENVNLGSALVTYTYSS